MGIKKFPIHSQEGIENLLINLLVKIKESDLEVLGIMLDADLILENRWQSVTNLLIDAGYQNINPTPDPQGIILESLSDNKSILPKLGIWMMPNNIEPGALENFLVTLIPKSDILLPHAKEIIDKLPCKPFDETNYMKAVMHTWLAWQKQPGRPYGVAIKLHYLDPDLHNGKVFVNWLQKTFFSVP